MIYKLDTDFTKIEQTKGIMENKSIHSEIEVLVTDGVPEKDTGIELRPREKLSFTLEDGKSLYARCSDLNHAGVNLAVVNFNVPASSGAGAGYELTMDVLYSGLAAKVGTYNFAKPADQYKMLLVTTPGHQCQQILPMGSTSGRFLKIYADTTYQINILLTAHKNYFEITWASVSKEWGFNGIETIYGIK